VAYFKVVTNEENHENLSGKPIFRPRFEPEISITRFRRITASANSIRQAPLFRRNLLSPSSGYKKWRPSHLRLGLPTKTLYALLYHSWYVPSQTPYHDSNTIWRRVHIMKAVDGGNGLQIRWTDTNILNKRTWGGPPHPKKKNVTKRNTSYSTRTNAFCSKLFALACQDWSCRRQRNYSYSAECMGGRNRWSPTCWWGRQEHRKANSLLPAFPVHINWKTSRKLPLSSHTKSSNMRLSNVSWQWRH
jgi:hypothetical protein